MLSIALCDDEDVFLECEKKEIKEYMRSKNIEAYVDTFKSGEEFLNSNYHKYDIVFLDMDMPKLSGMEVANRLRQKQVDIVIVFMTAFIQYSIDGYRVNAYRYILKEDFTKNCKSLRECFDSFLKEKNIHEDIVSFKVYEGVRNFYTGRIVYLEVEMGHINIYVIEKEKLVKYRMKGRKKLSDFFYLKDYNFCCIHKSYLVNMDYVNSVVRYTAYLTVGNKKIEIAQPKYNDVYDAHIEYKRRKIW